MFRAGAKVLQSGHVKGRAIAFVSGKSIVWICLVEAVHQAVTGDFRDDGGRCDGETLRVATNDCLCTD